jgi:hypothetical protein
MANCLSVLAVQTAHIPLSGLTTVIDGVAIDTDGYRVLVLGQTPPTDNGVWVAHAGAWTRPTDFDVGSSQLGTVVNITSGDLFANSSWLQAHKPPAVVGTSRLQWTYTSSMSSAWPVGSVFLSVVATNPALLLGFGTWQAISAGRMLVGVNAGDTDFDTAEKTGGAKTATPAGAVAAPVFTGSTNQATSSVSAGTPAGTINAHTTAADSTTTGGTAKVTGPSSHTFTGSALAGHSHTITPAGTNSAPAFTGSSMSILPPYLAVFLWKRTA